MSIDPTQKFVVKGTGRVVTLACPLGEGRFICTDNEGKCHPCYNLSDLVPVPKYRGKGEDLSSLNELLIRLRYTRPVKGT